MPDIYTILIFVYGAVMGGLMIYTVVLGVRQYLREEKKKSLEKENGRTEEKPAEKEK